MGKLISEEGASLKATGEKSMPIKVAVGSGARPTPSVVKIMTSAPTEPHTLGRAPGGWLK